MSQYSMYMLRTGFNGTYLGDYSESDTVAFINRVEKAFPVDVLFDEGVSDEGLRLAANPAQGSFSEFTKKDVQDALNGPHNALRVVPLPSRIEIGPFRGSSFTEYTVAQAAEIPLEVAAANLAVFFPSTRKKIPLYLLEKLRKNKEITSKDIRELEALAPKDKKRKGAHPETLANLLVTQILRGNTKMVKTKIPEGLGIGDLTEDPTLREAPVGGSVGLSFLPNFMVLRDSKDTGQTGLLPLMQKLKKDARYKKDARLAAGIDLTIEVLSKFTAKKDGCPYASPGCRMVCLADSGQRYAASEDYFGKKTDKFDERVNRLLLGFTQTAFLANPLAFLRVLIEAVLQHSLDHQVNVSKYLLEERARGKSESDFSVEQYVACIPPSVRLNVFSDYPWELIYPDLFGLFDGRTAFPGEGIYPRVQFYDYTKIPGRWSPPARHTAQEYVSGPLSLAEDYNLPENYHITFSFNGSPKSKTFSDICSSAGQNATFVFFTQELGNALVGKLFPEEHPKVSKFLSELRRFFKKSTGNKPGTFLKTGVKGSLLPESYEGIRVIDGDNYDLRFLDKSYSDDRLIVGLNWKNPNGFRIEISGVKGTKTVDPFRASGGSTVSWAGEIEGRKLELAASFGVVRYGLSTDFPEGVRIYFIRKGTPSAKSIRETMAELAKLGELTPDVTFATETGKAINSTDDYQFQRQDVISLLEELGIEVDSEISQEDLEP